MFGCSILLPYMFMKRQDIDSHVAVVAEGLLLVAFVCNYHELGDFDVRQDS